MKIGISGVSCTGKTTLTKAVSEALGLPALLDAELHEMAFAVMDQNGWTPHTRIFPQMHPYENINFERAVFTARVEQEAKLSGRDFVADETPLDFINYAYIMCSPFPQHMTATELEDLIERWRRMFDQYDMIVYLPFGVLPIQDDQRRYTNFPLLRHWDHAMQGTIQDYERELDGKFYVMPPTDNLESRVSYVMKSIGDLLKKG